MVHNESGAYDLSLGGGSAMTVMIDLEPSLERRVREEAVRHGQDVAEPSDPRHAVARAAINELIGRGDEVFITAQNVVEFWNVATRPADRNGFGMTLALTFNSVDFRRFGISMIEPGDLSASPP
jgi:hypothetical protein